MRDFFATIWSILLTSLGVGLALLTLLAVGIVAAAVLPLIGVLVWRRARG